jgi:hypothetical protein
MILEVARLYLGCGRLLIIDSIQDYFQAGEDTNVFTRLKKT